MTFAAGAVAPQTRIIEGSKRDYPKSRGTVVPQSQVNEELMRCFP